MFSKESIHPPILNQQEFHKKKKKGEVDDNDKTFTFAHTIAKDQWILEKLFEFTSSVGNIRLLCKSLNHLVENNLYKLRVGSGIPRRTLQRIMLKMPKLRIVDFSNMKSDLNDRQVLAVYETLPLLQYLDVTDCPNLTERILVCKPAGIFLKIRGCWRAISPNPFLQPHVVVQLQFLALKHGSRKSIAKQHFMKFLCPGYSQNATHAIDAIVKDVFRCHSFDLRVLFNLGNELSQFHISLINRAGIQMNILCQCVWSHSLHTWLTQDFIVI
mmetsp:Transcript_26151/g.32620  ORF Transcript_26151/g.32620 Transcript_26151/m.32620 type:complete len:271 (-) Transcript_26151:166-978(-)